MKVSKKEYPLLKYITNQWGGIVTINQIRKKGFDLIQVNTLLRKGFLVPFIKKRPLIPSSLVRATVQSGGEKMKSRDVLLII